MAHTKRNIVLLIWGVLLLSGIAYLVFKNASNKTISPRDWPEIEADGVLNIVTEYNSVDYYVSGDSIAGRQYDLCQYIEKRSGLKVKIFLENNLENCIQNLKNNTCDIIALNIPITNEGKKELAFTVPITQNKQVLIQRKPKTENDTLIRNQLDLAYKTIYISKNSPCILRLHNLSEEIAEPIYIKEVEDYSQEQLLSMVAYQEIDYAVVDKGIAVKNEKLFPEIDMKTDISFTQLQAWAVRQNAPVLLDSLNRWISERR